MNERKQVTVPFDEAQALELCAGDQVLMTREPERSMADRITEVWEKALEYLGL
ncbi:MAG: hypothetical protein RR197_01690 [Oscillospiraceae bacterium]